MIVAAIALPTGVAAAEARHGFSPFGALQNPPGFTHFAYVNPEAPKGGVLRIDRVERYDSLNGLHYPGRTPADLRLTYDSLLVSAADEPGAVYGLLAESVAVSPDWSAATFTLRSEARWRDGAPVTSADIAFTIETLQAQGAPFYRQTLRGITVEADGPTTVTVRARQPGDRDFVARIGALPIHSAAYWAERDVTASTLDPPMGGGPYRVTRAEPNRLLELARDPDYWGRDLGVNRGRWNFDEVKLTYFRDSDVALESFLAGRSDFRIEADTQRWATGYNHPSVNAGAILRETAPADDLGRNSTLVFNLRRPPFDRPQVREALGLAYDFTWTNETLYSGQLDPPGSAFGDSDLAARGRATDAEWAIIADHMGADAAAIRTAPGPDAAPEGLRARLTRAARLLDESGLVIIDGVRMAPGGRRPFTIAAWFRQPDMERPLGNYAENLRRLGIQLDYRALEPGLAAQVILDKDFDMTVLNWTASRTPGTAEGLLWGSALADAPRSYALAGARDPALDAAINAMRTARDYGRLTAAARAFDRVLQWRRYALPLWRDATVRFAWRTGFERPKTAADLSPSPLDRWWSASPETVRAETNTKTE